MRISLNISKQTIPLLLGILFSITALGQKITVSASETHLDVEQNEDFKINYTIKIQGDLEDDVDNIGFEVKGLTLKGMHNAGESTSSTYINGKFTSSRNITVQASFKAPTIGLFTIPSYKIKYQGKLIQSSPVTVKVSKAKKVSGISGKWGVKLEPTKNSVYVGESFKVNLVYWSVANVRKYQPIEVPKFDGFVAKELETKPKQKIKKINGRETLIVHQTSYLLTPLKPGKLKLPSVKGVIHVVTRGFGMFTEPHEVSSTPLSINVKALPNGAPNDFSGLVGDFNIEESVDKSELAVDDAVTVRVKIKGTGNLNGFEDIQIEFPSAFESLEPTSKSSINATGLGFKGSKIFEFVAIPRQPGDFTIPGVQLSYFDLKSNSYKTIQSNSVQIKVTGDGTAVNSGFSPNSGSQKVEVQGSDIRYLKNDVGELNSGKTTYYTGSPLHLGLSALGLVGFIAGWFVFKPKNYSNSEIKSMKKNRANKVAHKFLKNAKSQLNGDSAEFFEAIDNAISEFLLGKLMIDRSQLNKAKIKEILMNKGVSEGLIEKTLNTSDQCKMARFSPLNISQGDMLSKAESIINELESELK